MIISVGMLQVTSVHLETQELYKVLLRPLFRMKQTLWKVCQVLLLAQYARHLGEKGLGDPGLHAGRWFFFLTYNLTCSRSKAKMTDFVIKMMYSIRTVEKWFPQRKWSIQKDTPNQILGCTLQTHTLHMALSPTKQSLCISSQKHL